MNHVVSRYFLSSKRNNIKPGDQEPDWRASINTHLSAAPSRRSTTRSRATCSRSPATRTTVGVMIIINRIGAKRACTCTAPLRLPRSSTPRSPGGPQDDFYALARTRAGLRYRSSAQLTRCSSKTRCHSTGARARGTPQATSGPPGSAPARPQAQMAPEESRARSWRGPRRAGGRRPASPREAC